jgi:hypothetical protein
MHVRHRSVLGGLIASLLLGLAVSSASANRFSVSNTKFRVTWASLSLTDLSLVTVRCPVTLEGSLHSATIRKVAGALIGAVTRGIVKGESCTGGKATILQESLPWHVTYEGFVGTLPAIEAIILLLRRYALRAEALGVGAACLYKDRGRAEENLAGLLEINAAGRIGRFIPLANRYAGLFSGGFACPQRAFIEGEAEVFLLGNTTRITVTLI